MRNQRTSTVGSASGPDPTRFVSEVHRTELAARRAICELCDLQRGFTVLTVKCKRCGCAGLSLLHGRCPLRKWDSDASGNGNDAAAKEKQADSPLDAKKENGRLRSDEQPAAPRIDPIDDAVKKCEQAASATRRLVVQRMTRDVGKELGCAIDRIAVIGHPSRVGGADTELDHQIRCWQAMGLEVHICPTHGVDAHMRSLSLAERGCIYHEPRDWASLTGMHCISFCNGEFLKNLESIRKHAKSTTFVNCMTWNFPLEIEGQRRGFIDFHLYQTEHAMQRVGEKLAATQSAYRPLRFTPYFHADDFPYFDDRPTSKFRFGRISRPDADKYHSRQMWIYETMTAPVLKEGIIVGWDGRAEKKVGSPPSYVKTYPANGVSQQAFYRFCEAIIMTTDTFENLPRVGFEAMASGSVLVVDDRGGWRDQVEQGVTGWRCKSDREFVYLASRLAFESDERQRMRRAARERLEAEWGLPPAMASWRTVFDAWEWGAGRTTETPRPDVEGTAGIPKSDSRQFQQ